MTEQPQAYAKHGKILITVGYASRDGDLDAEEFTPEAASKLTVAISVAIRDARDQLRAIEEACANGHQWGDGWNTTHLAEKITTYACTREGCDGRRIDPGWLPFEPKQHIIPGYRHLVDCTGPGCHHCDEESFADAFHRCLASATKKLNEEFLPLLGAGAAGLAFDTTTILEVNKIGYEWTVDATPEQVQAALDARDAGNCEPWSDAQLKLGAVFNVTQCPNCGHSSQWHAWNGCDHQGCCCPTSGTADTTFARAEQEKANRLAYERHLEDADQPQFPVGDVLTLNDLQRARDRMFDNSDRHAHLTDLYVIGSCSCQHPIAEHAQLGCRYCPCLTPIDKLAAKITGVGTEDTTP
jgi:hypothetical protein